MRGVALALLLDCRASLSVEIAVMGPMFVALLTAILQIALVFMAQGALETTAEQASRLIMTGQAQTYAGTTSTGTTYTGMTQADFKSAACTELRASAPFLSCSNLYVDVTTVSAYSSAVMGLPLDSKGKLATSFNYSVGTQGTIVVLRLIYQWPTVSAPLGFTLSNQSDGSRLLLATSVFKSEPYVTS
ncbi:MAG TPA: TadE/TadG family type IV pilus assembly protein [Novosphingobium sp.]|nr:TadE/TadG family type IV pilus assembly protein [Novosphingobium sp.]